MKIEFYFAKYIRLESPSIRHYCHSCISTYTFTRFNVII